MLGRQCYQNWQHVYTAVTRGVRQVIILHNPSSLRQAVTRLPVTRKTKLKEDMVQALRYERQPDEYNRLNNNTQIASESGVCYKNAPASRPVDAMETTPAFSGSEVDGKGQAWLSEKSPSLYESRLNATSSSNDFCISGENVKFKQRRQEQVDQRHLPASSGNGTSYELAVHPYEKVLVNPSEVSGLHSPDHEREYPDSTIFLSPSERQGALEVNGVQNPGHKRKNTESTVLLSPPKRQIALEASGSKSPGDKRKHAESSILLSPPQTPPHFRQLSLSLSSVSPLRQTSRETQKAADKMPTRNAFTAQYDGRCKVCQDPIRKGEDQITVVRKPGSNKSWIHERCSTSGQQ